MVPCVPSCRNGSTHGKGRRIMATMSEIARLVHAYAPKLDETEKVKFSMFIHNQYADESLDGLNLATEWRAYNA